MPAGDDPDLDDLFKDAPETEKLDAGETAPGDAAPELAGEAGEGAAEDATAEKPDADETPTPAARPERPRGPKKPWWDVYTSMLALALLAIIFGCVFLLMEWSRYNFESTPTATPAASAGAAAD